LTKDRMSTCAIPEPRPRLPKKHYEENFHSWPHFDKKRTNGKDNLPVAELSVRRRAVISS
jgi:hypothetical protein